MSPFNPTINQFEVFLLKDYINVYIFKIMIIT